MARLSEGRDEDPSWPMMKTCSMVQQMRLGQVGSEGSRECQYLNLILVAMRPIFIILRL